MVKCSNSSHEKHQVKKQQQMLNSAYPHVKEASINKSAFPLHILQLAFQSLKVTTASLAVQNDLVSACLTLEYKIQIINNKQKNRLYITKVL